MATRWINVKECARCGNEHLGLTASPFVRSPKDWTHFATCPESHQPILVRFVLDGKDKLETE